VAAGDQVAVPTQHGVGPHHQPHPTQHLGRQTLKQRRKERPVYLVCSAPSQSRTAARRLRPSR
jgi:rhodanese-related sulfurtransferase